MAIAIVLVFAGAAVGQPTYTITQVGFTGPDYTFGPANGFTQNSIVHAVTPTGYLSGNTARSVNSNGDLGQDGWVYNGSETVQMGFTGTGYSYSTSSGTYEYTQAGSINDSGEAIGFSDRYSSTGTSLGQDAWFYNGSSTEEIGLTRTNFSYTTTGGTYQSSLALGLDDAGMAVGTSPSYSSTGQQLGEDAWYFNGTSTQEIGLTGPQYTTTTAQGSFQSDKAYEIQNPMSANGDVAGESERYGTGGQNLGYDQWYFNGSTTQLIGLTGSLYSAPSSAGNSVITNSVAISASGAVVGDTARFSGTNSLGVDSWIFNGSTTSQIAPTGQNYSYTTANGTYESSFPGTINSAGDAIGDVLRYAPNGVGLGMDGWYYNGTTSIPLALGGANHSYATSDGAHENNNVLLMNNTGGVTGYTTRYNSSGTSLGLDSWYFNGTTVQQIGITATQDSFAGYPGSGGTYQSSISKDINDAGDVIGISDRYTTNGSSLGQDGWLFDPSLDETFLLQFSVDSATDASTTTPELVTNAGAVLGTYELYDGSVDEGLHGFYWTENTGFSDLGSLINDGLSGAGWQELDFFASYSGADSTGDPIYIDGDGYLVGQTTTSGDSGFLMTLVVPEPTSACLVFMSAIGLLVRRRTRAAA